MSTTDTEVWGNIELPGLSDEILFKKNWHHVGVNKERGQTQEHKSNCTKNNIETWQDPKIRDRRLKGIREANKKPEVIANKTEANRRNAHNPIVYQKNLQNIMSRAREVIDDEGNSYISLSECARQKGKAIGTIQYYIQKGKYRYAK